MIILLAMVIEQGVEAFAVALGRSAVAAPDHAGQEGLEDGPDLLGELAGDIFECHDGGLLMASSDTVRITIPTPNEFFPPEKNTLGVYIG